MQTLGRLLLYGLCFFFHRYIVRGIRYVPTEAIHFTQCKPGLKQCPTNSTCDEANNNTYYCACENNFYNAKDKLTLTYPGGECLELCDKGKTFPCACRRGYVLRLNENGLYTCADKCRNDSDCPSGAFCSSGNCFCKVCKLQAKDCKVTLDNACSVLSTTTIALQTTAVYMGDTAPYTPAGSPTTEPDPSTTTIPWLTSSMNMTNTSAYMHQTIRETSYNPSTISTVELSITPQSKSRRTSEAPQPVIDRCEAASKTKHECEEHNNTNPLCTFLKSMVHITEDACENNKINTSVQITDVLNRTSLKKFTITDLQKVVIAVIENVETSLLASFSTELKNEHINTSEIEAKMKVSHDHCGNESSISLTIHDNKMEVPCSLVDFAGGGAMFISYKGLNDKLNGSILAAFGDSDHRNKEVISPVVGGAITGDNTENLASPVNFFLKHLKAVNSSSPLQCVFWDTKNEVWSTRGCTTERLDRENSTRCICSHLSTFAVIMAPTKIKVDAGLKLLSVIGLSISLVCLFLSFLTFILCRSLRSAHTSVLTVLCGCLFLGQLLVLVGLQQTGNKILCSVIAGSLKFLFLCAFCWMSLESILLFLTVRNLQALNYMNSQRSHFPYICLVGFGIPAIIITVSASLYPDMYGEEKHCWLKVNYVWSFLGPVCVFITVNFILLVITFWLLRKKLASLNSNVSTLKHTRLLTFKAFSQLFILGCTWIIGLFQFGSGSLIASYIFTICNSLQGVYIFIVHCLLNRQVREEYSRAYRRLYSKPSVSETMSGSTMPMSSKTSQVSEVSKEDNLCSWEKKNDKS